MLTLSLHCSCRHTGGTSACLIASRLADADPTLKILLVESGPHTQDDLAHLQPARFLSHIAPTTKAASFMIANPEKELLGRETVVPCGNCVGGGSSMNCKCRARGTRVLSVLTARVTVMMYTRAAASDYDDWENKFKNPGWGSKDLIPLLKKVYEFSNSRNGLLTKSARLD